MIDRFGDRDWVAIDLISTTEYTFELIGADSDGTLSDPYLRLYDKNGNILDENNDGKGNTESSLTYTASESSTYYLSASNAYIDSGSYLLNTTVSSERDFGDFSPYGATNHEVNWSGIDGENDYILGLMWVVDGEPWRKIQTH